MKAGQPGEALPFLARAVARDPERHDARTEYGLALLTLHRFDEAARQFEEALNRQAGDAAVQGLCLAYASLPGHEATATATARRWSDKNPGAFESMNLLAEVFARSRQFAAAFDEFSKMVHQYPSQPTARVGQAVMAAALGRPTEARRMLEATAKLFPSDSRVRHTFARLLVGSPDESTRNGQMGLEMIETLFRMRPSPDLAETAAMALAEVGRFDEAVDRQRWAIEHARDYGTAFRARLDNGLQRFGEKSRIREVWPFGDEARRR